MEEWQKHISKSEGVSWCEAPLSSMDWSYLHIDHAAKSAPRDRLQPCPSCVRAVVLALTNGRDENPGVPLRIMFPAMAKL